MGNTTLPEVPKYQTFTSKNPYAKATMGQYGSSYKLNPFLTSQNQFIEQNVPALYNQLLNPSLNNPIYQARTDAFTNALNSQSQNAFENNIINPLSQRRMLRSSLLNDLANNLQKTQTEQISDFNNEQLANSLSDTQSLINLLMNQYKANSSYGQSTLADAMNGASALNSYNLSAYDRSYNRALAQSKLPIQNTQQYLDIARQVAKMII